MNGHDGFQYYPPTSDEKKQREIAMSRIIDEVDNWTSEEYGLPLHHYVRDRNVLELIAEHGQLRLTRFDMMKSDPDEVRFASTLFAECIKELLTEEYISQEEADRLMNSVAFSKDARILYFYSDVETFRSENGPFIPYIVCFTPEYTERMWKEYNDTATVDMTITEHLIDCFMRGDHPSGFPIDRNNYLKLLKVRYDGPETRTMIKKLILDAQKAGNLDDWCKMVREILMICRLAIKPKKFAYENEYRLVYIRPEHFKENDRAMQYICRTHFDIEERGVVENDYDPTDDRFVWIDITPMIHGATLGRSDLYKDRLQEIARRGTDFFVDRYDDILRYEAMKRTKRDESACDHQTSDSSDDV